MSLSLQINRDESRPLYQQIAAQIKNQISLGRLPPGTRLPSVRQMALKLGVTRLTVHNAYGELQADGWVESTVGRGTFVLAQPQTMTLLSTIGDDFSPETVLRDILPIKQMPTIRSLAYAEPDLVLAPTDDIWGTLAAMRRTAANYMGYSSPQGDATLRVELVEVLKERGITAMPDEIIITNGSMQGLSLVAQALGRRGDTVLVEQPTYMGMIHILEVQGLRPIPIPFDDEGPDLNAIERALRIERPRFMYTVPRFIIQQDL